MTAQISFTGNATADAELRFGSSGTPIASFTVAVTPREKQQDGSYGDGPSAFYRVACFGPLAENVAESVQRGTRVVVAGTLKPREFEHNGEKRMSLDVDADSIALDLRWATAQAVKAGRSQPQPAQSQQPAQADPWNQSTGGGGWGGTPTEQIPF